MICLVWHVRGLCCGAKPLGEVIATVWSTACDGAISRAATVYICITACVRARQREYEARATGLEAWLLCALAHGWPKQGGAHDLSWHVVTATKSGECTQYCNQCVHLTPYYVDLNVHKRWPSSYHERTPSLIASTGEGAAAAAAAGAASIRSLVASSVSTACAVHACAPRAPKRRETKAPSSWASSRGDSYTSTFLDEDGVEGERRETRRLASTFQPGGSEVLTVRLRQSVVTSREQRGVKRGGGSPAGE